ncbi:zinc ribbon domain-containing protein [Streptomyces sp. NPDC048258]|uniref:zinc ribbon domain-containing protein n=1 Tax=Streptomyces sp. NPDC048258 TaxID=3365527 RepID=UPI003711EF02
MSRKLPLAEGETTRIACARGLLRAGVDEESGELLTSSVLAERVGWVADLVSAMAAELLAAHWNAPDVAVLASREDCGGRRLPSNAWMALRRLGWPHQGRVRVDLPHTHPVPKAARTGHTVALGVDWGLNTLLTAGAARLHDDGRITALGSGGMFRAAGVLAKQHRLRRQGERLHAKSDQYQRLAAGDEQHALAAKHTVLSDEIAYVSARRSNLNDALARAAARWAVDQAVAAGASVIYVEDLRSLEARGMGHSVNTRLSQQVRGQIVDRMRHLAAETGMAVVTVPARNTSRHCPRCLTPLRHRKAPDRPTTPGWKWAICPTCRWQADRDQGAWQRIAARGLTHQAKTACDRTTGVMAIRRVVDTLEAGAVITPSAPKTSRQDRSKTGPTRRHTTRPTPRRRRTPSPARSSGPAGKRPEGHAHTGRRRLRRAADRHQGVTTISTPTTGRHRPRGAALGAGFHLHAHATPPRWERVLSRTRGPAQDHSADLRRLPGEHRRAAAQREPF